MLLSILLRALVLLRQTIATTICAGFLLGVLLLVLPLGPAAARPVANVPTASPAPPTAEPPTAVPPTAVPPTAEPPTAAPPTAAPPTNTPEPPPPTATSAPRRERREKPAATPEPPQPTSAPEPSPTEPPSAEVLIAKSVDASQLQRGDTALYTISVRNAGGSLARDVVVSDDVPAALEVIDLQSTKGDIVASGQGVTAYPATLEPGEEATIHVRVRVRPDAPAGLLVNLALVTTSAPGDDPSNNTDTAQLTVVVPAAPAPRLPRTAETVLGPQLPWWLPWLVVAAGLVVIGAVIRCQIEPALRRRIAANETARLPRISRAQPSGSSISRRPLGRPARRRGYVRQAPGRAAIEPVALASPAAARDHMLHEIAELERIRVSLLEQRLRLLQEAAALAQECAHKASPNTLQNVRVRPRSSASKPADVRPRPTLAAHQRQERPRNHVLHRREHLP